MTTPWQKEWNRMQRQEYEYLQKGRFRKESRLNRLLEKHIPDALQDKLDLAFSKAFELIFEKGTGVIEKTYNKNGIEESFVEKREEALSRGDRESLRHISNKAGAAGGRNLLFSGGAGIGMGILGVGLPDIPLFTATMLKGIYEIALHFGYSYDTPQEKYFILRIIEASLCCGKELDKQNAQINRFLDRPELPKDYDQRAQIRKSSAALSTELLYMKFLQGVPVVGAVGGAYDAIYMNKITKYAQLKYHRRFLIDHSDPLDGPALA